MLVKKVVVVVVMFVVSTFTWPSHLVVSKVLPSLAMLSDSPGEGQQAGRGGGRGREAERTLKLTERVEIRNWNAKEAACVCGCCAWCV